MAIQFVTSQIKNDAITADKVQLASGTYAFTSGATVRWAKDPSNADDLVRKSYVDAIAAGLHWKDSVLAASTANLTLSGTQTVDGVSLSADDRILVKDQSDAEDNGIYVVAAGAWSRASDMNAADEFPGAAVFVRSGSANADSGWVCTNDTNPTVGTTDVVFAQFSGAGQITAGNGLAKSGNTLSVNVDDSSIEINSDSLRVKASGITSAMLAGSIANAKLANSAITIAGTSTSLGGSITAATILNTDMGGDFTIGNQSDNVAVFTGPIKVTGNQIKDNDDVVCIAFDSSGNTQIANALSVDMLVEKTSANGVSIDSVLMKDGGISLGAGGTLVMEGATANANELTLTCVDPTADRTITFPNVTGTVITSGDSGSVSTAMLADTNVTPAKLAFETRYNSFNGNGSATAFNLTHRILDADWRVPMVARNGQILEQVNSSPSDFQFTCTDDGSATTITFATAPENGDKIFVWFMA